MKTPLRLLLLAAAALAALFVTSCAALTSAATGQPIQTETVTAEDGTAFQVASSDVFRTRQADPDTAWGLYNAGAAAAKAREVINSGK